MKELLYSVFPLAIITEAQVFGIMISIIGFFCIAVYNDIRAIRKNQEIMMRNEAKMEQRMQHVEKAIDHYFAKFQ